MSAAAFESALAGLYTDDSLREHFLREPEAALARFDLTAQERADLCLIDRAGLEMAAASYAHKLARRKGGSR
jgi:hypothetical protein